MIRELEKTYSVFFNYVVRFNFVMSTLHRLRNEVLNFRAKT
jgi:hypothetical protein